MIECQNKFEVDNSIFIPSWTKPVLGMHTRFCDQEDQYRIQYIPDIVYVTRHRPLHLHLFTHWTLDPEKKYPVVVHIRGSGWTKQDVLGFLPQLTEIARCGYIVASIEYRTTEENCGFPAQVEDTKAAIHFLQEHAAEFQIDGSRIAVMGDSSGGHTALLTGFTGINELCAPEERDIDLHVKCIVDFFGPTNFATLLNYPCGMDNASEAAPHSRLAANSLYPISDRAFLSPITYVEPERNLPATLIIHGDKDRMVPFAQSVELFEKMRDQGHPVDFYMIRNGEHGSKIWIPSVMEIVKGFLKANL